MQQAVFHRYPAISVAAEFRCRGDELLGEYADEIRAQVALMSRLALTDAEFAYLGPALLPSGLSELAADVSLRSAAGDRREP